MSIPTATHHYSDPTGGGDDASLTLPVWAQAPGILTVYDADGERYDFKLDESS